MRKLMAIVVSALSAAVAVSAVAVEGPDIKQALTAATVARVL